MTKKQNKDNIVLGEGVFYVGTTPIGFTRDGGNFSVEYENHEIKADGDKGPAKGRIRRTKAVAKLQINHLEMLTEIDKMHPGTSVATSEGKKVMTDSGVISDADYHQVNFVGSTNAGKELSILLKNAINLENISWDLKDKDEIIDVVTYTATYDDSDTSGNVPYSVEWVN